MRSWDPWIEEPLASGIRCLSLRPHGIYHPGRKESAVGFDAVVFFRKHLNEMPAKLRTRRFDTVLPCGSQCESHFQATVLALSEIQGLPLSMREAPLRVHAQDSNVAWVLTQINRPQLNEHVPTEVQAWRQELIRIVSESPRRPFVDSYIMSRSGVRSKFWGKRFGALEKRLLARAWGLKKRPADPRMRLDVEAIGWRLAEVGWDPGRSPPMLGLMTEQLTDAGYSLDQIAGALGLEKRRLYQGKARWKKLGTQSLGTSD